MVAGVLSLNSPVKLSLLRKRRKIVFFFLQSFTEPDLSQSIGLERCGKSCRLRWINYLRPDLKRGAFSSEEQNLIVELHAVLGNR